MSTTATPLPSATTSPCPVDHAQFASKRTYTGTPPSVRQDPDGTWQIYDYDLAKAILRGDQSAQAGFKAELLGGMPAGSRRPILYTEGADHLEQRKQTARFFTPKAVSGYRPAMETVADQMVNKLKTARRVDLRELSLGMAMRVVSEVVGLTHSTKPGIEKRLDVFLTDETNHGKWHPATWLRVAVGRYNVLRFFQLDVKPAIDAHRLQPKDDLISYLLEQGYKDWEIFTEAVTYGAAGMATTREFIGLAVWHLMAQPALRDRYLVAGEDERNAILQEVLRLEPIVAHLLRRTQQPIHLDSGGQSVDIPAGALVNIHVQAVNADESVVGAGGQALCPAREMHKQVVMPSVISFGDGHHRCPGAYVALQETDVLLQRLLRLPGFRIERNPNIGWNTTANGPELHDFWVAVD